MKVLDLCSGIGGFTIGLHEAGFETVAFCEIEPYCQAVLKKHWPDIPIYNDVRDISAERLRSDGIVQPEVVVGGYPCQPFSVAGKRRGDQDDRHIWPEIFRIVKDIRPTWCIFENVAGHITMGIDTVLSDLESANYATRAFIIPAVGVDAPHKRDRVWIVANAKSKQGSSKNNRSEQRKAGEPKQGKFGRNDSGSLQQRKWVSEPRVGRVVDGVPNRAYRNKALGNAVVPEIPRRIGQVIMEMENDRLSRQGT